MRSFSPHPNPPHEPDRGSVTRSGLERMGLVDLTEGVVRSDVLRVTDPRSTSEVVHGFEAQNRIGGNSLPMSSPRVPIFPKRSLWAFFIAASLAFSLRDFAGASMSTLGSLFLQKAHGFSLQATGVALSGIFIASAVSNPLFGHLSDRGRGRWGALVLLIAASLMALFPHAPVQWLLPIFVVYGFFQMASYPIVEAALMEAVPNAVRGRVMGFWITVGGVVGNLAHWIMGQQVQSFAAQASHPQTYFGLYGVLGLLMLLSLLGFPCLHAIRKREP